MIQNVSVLKAERIQDWLPGLGFMATESIYCSFILSKETPLSSKRKHLFILNSSF